MDTQIFNGGESPLASQADAASSMSHGQTGAAQSDGGSATNPAEGEATSAPASSAADPSIGGIMRARNG